MCVEQSVIHLRVNRCQSRKYKIVSPGREGNDRSARSTRHSARWNSVTATGISAQRDQRDTGWGRTLMVAAFVLDQWEQRSRRYIAKSLVIRITIG
ncbi:hypothetical protein AVEN_58907-1 [Araneus ventricosus]|uniref:Uncharacterized protein n=1 Tax=Araneus ventricosus TaxID=182803 RepID=A0A4Y2ET55_ARAVE|nr:hypothetical protein AVEN_58907-1 [Araneus ventricosus]